MMTSPMLLDHCDARVASQQSSILRKGVYSLPMKCPLDKSKKRLSRSDTVKKLEGTLVAQAFTGPVVQCSDIGPKLLVRQNHKVGIPGHVLTQKSVGIFVGASLPGMIRMCEEDLQAKPAFEFGRTGELTPIVQCEAVAFRAGQSADSPPQALSNRLCGTAPELSCDQIAAGAVHAGQNIPFASFTHNRIAFPITESPAFFSLLWPLINRAFSHNLTPAGGFAVWLTSGFSGNSQEGTEPKGPLWITPNPAVDRRMTDSQAFKGRRSTSE